MKKIYYLGYFSDNDDENCRKTAPSADTKMKYIITTLKACGYDVEVISFCENDDRNSFFSIHTGYTKDVNGTKTKFVTNYSSKYRIIRILGRVISHARIKKALMSVCSDPNSIIVIYHSLGLLYIIKFLNKIKHKFILEMEEVYSDVIKAQYLRKREISAAKTASAFIFPTQLLDKVINVSNKPSIIIHGTYQIEQDRNCNVFKENLQGQSDAIIHCVYAGTLDPRKGGAAAAAAAAEYLPDCYHIHILGFGSDQQIQDMKDLVANISSRSDAKVTYDGLLSGEEYVRFIQSCDIGLSTQDPTAAFNATSFPSKILSYMANGLRVVSIRIPAIEQSSVGNELYYYDMQTPEEIAKAIQSVDLSFGNDPRQKISVLANRFEQEIGKLLDGV